MKKRIKKNKAALSIEDFVFPVIYSREAGYGNHVKQRMAQYVKNDLEGVQTVPGHPFKMTEWCPITGCFSDGMASVKYCGTCTLNGIKKLIYESAVSIVEETAGSLTPEYGLIPAVSLSTEYNGDPYHLLTNKEALKEEFGDDYYDAIDELQGITHKDIYVSCIVPEWRIEEIFYSVFGVKHNETLEAMKRNILSQIAAKCEKLIQYIRSLTDDYRYSYEFNPQEFIMDCRQLEIPFEYENSNY